MTDNDEQSYREEEWGGSIASIIMISVARWTEAGLALAACKDMAGRCLSSRSQLIGVALFGTMLDDDKGLDNVVQLMPLKDVTLQDLAQLEKLAADNTHLQRKWGTADHCNLSSALWLASRMFSSCKKRTIQQNLILVGHLPEPPDDPTSRRAALKKAADLLAMNIHLQMIVIGNDNLPEDSFYRELSEASSTPPFEWIPPPVVSMIEELTPLVWQNSQRKRAFCNLNMQLGEGIELGVGIYYLCKEKSTPRTVNLERETNERVIYHRQLKKVSDNEQTSLPLLTSELCYYQTFGGKTIEFTAAERAAVRKFSGPPCLKLLGFKNRSSLDLTRSYCKQSTFLFPDERQITGSEKLFLCLRDRCTAADKVAICVLVMRWHSFPRLVALVPQKRIENNGRQVQPDGFHVVFLPFAEEMKDIAVPGTVETTEEQLACAQKIIKKLRFNYSEDIFENPKLEKLYSAIEALALESTEAREVDDMTIPQIEIQCERLGPLQDKFHELFGPFGIVATKRKNQNPPKQLNKKKSNN